MTTATFSKQVVDAANSAARNAATATTGILLILMIPALIASWVDPRLFNGANVWIKPFHFLLSLSIHLATLIVFIPLLNPEWRDARLIRWTMLAASVSAVLEVAYISFQAARGRASHFNDTTPLEAAAYGLMGIGALLLVLCSAVLGWAIFRHAKANISPGLKSGVALGLLVGSAATLIIAGYMSSLSSHLIGGPQTDAYGLPFLGWATRGGDLRVPHFFATHAMQALPIAGLILDRTGMSGARWMMPAVGLAYFALVAALFVQALMGIPLIPM